MERTKQTALEKMETSPDNIKFTSQISFCSYSLSLDLYKGCPHNCQYCFAQTSHGETLNVSSRSTVNLFSFDKAIRYTKGDDKLKVNAIYAYVNKKQPYHIGGMADPFPYKIESETKHALSFIQQIGEYPCIWSTKNPPVEYRDEIGKGNHIIQFSTIGSYRYDKRVSKIEPGLPPFEKRFHKLKLLKPSVKKVIIRFQPFIPFLWTYDTLSRFFDELATVGDAVSIEFLKKPIAEKWEKLSEALGFDVFSFFQKSPAIDMGSDKVFDLTYRFEMLKLLKQMTHDRGMEFYSAENYFRYMSDGPACCGISEKDGKLFQSKLDYCFNTLLFKAKKEGSFTWDDVVAGAASELLNSKWVTGFDYALAKRKIKDVMRQRFQPKSGLSPSNMFCNLVPKTIKGKLHFVYEEKKWDGGFNLYLEDYDRRYGNSILKDAKRI